MKELLPYLPKPSHYLGNEINAVHKDGKKVCVRVGLAFPDVYEVGMSYLGQKILYKQVNDHPDFQAERVFAPSIEAAEILRKHDKPLCTLESDTLLADLDILAFSLTHELCYTNILYMLDLAGLALRSADRGNALPLVIAGGGAVFNAEPIADFFDLMVVGDGEKILVQIAEAVRDAKAEGRGKDEIINILKGKQGIYVPSIYRLDSSGGLVPDSGAPDRVKKALVGDLSDIMFPTDQIIPYGKIVHDRMSVEIARGCTRGCRFCQAGSIYRPVRERKVSDIIKIVNQGLRRTGFEELSFLSLSTGDFSALDMLFRESFARCQGEQVSISLPSLRVGSVSEDLMKLIARIRHTQATLAPEAGTQRLRNIINKGVDEHDLLRHTEILFRLGWNRVKLYFMIGLPSETEVDLLGIRDLCLKVLETGKTVKKRLQVTASISPFVPKPHTPFQWERQAGLEEIRDKLGFLLNAFKGHKKLNLKWHMPEMSILEGVFSRGGRELSGIVKEAYSRGQIFTSWTDCFALEPWLEIMDQTGLSPEKYLEERKEHESLPWNHLDCGVSRDHLLGERKRAFKGKVSSDCRYGLCRNCGVCDQDGWPSRLSGPDSVIVKNVINQKHRDQEETHDEALFEQKDMSARNYHFRIWYEKTGLSIYLSQLELQSLLERAMRRSGWPLSFSRGFKPAPLISFGQALSVGVASLAEWYNVFTRELMTEHEMLEGLNKNLVSGMRAYRVEPLSLGRKQSRAVREHFSVDFSCSGLPAEKLLGIWKGFKDKQEFIVDKQGKKNTVRRDLRKIVTKADWKGFELKLVLSREEDYLSPLFVVKSIFSGVSAEKIMITKTKQIMASS